MKSCVRAKYALLLSLAACLGVDVYAQNAQPASMPIKYQLDRDAKVSLLITGPDGQVVRELLHAAPQVKGSQQAPWDGLNDAGAPVAAGTYGWKLLATQGLKAEYLMSVGTNSTPQWEPWPGNHGPGTTLAADADGMYSATGCGEGTALAIKQSLDGQRKWTIPHWLDAWVGPGAMGSDGGQLYMLQINGKLRRADTATGQPNAAWDVAFEEDRKLSVWGDMSNITDIDAGAGQVVVSYALHNMVRWLNPSDGSEIDKAAVNQPYGIAVDKADASILVISDGQVLRLSRNDKTPKVVITREKLNSPRRLAVDPKTRDILVAENRGVQQWVQNQYFTPGVPAIDSLAAQNQYYGKNRTPGGDPSGGQQVKRFDAQGKQLAAYGAPAGRSYGNYSPSDFSGINDIAATADGGFIIGEDEGIRRVAHFDAGGKFVREWFGGWGYGQHAFVDSEDPTILWFPDRNVLLKTKIDLATKQWKVLAFYDIRVLSDWFGEGGQYWRVLRRQGTTYLARTGQGGMGPAILKIDEQQGKLIPAVMGVFNMGQNKEIKLAGAAQPLLAETYKYRPNDSSNIWNDVDGDGQPSMKEFEFSKWWTHPGCFDVDADFNWYFISQDDALKEVVMFKLPVNKWTEEGVPVYKIDDRQILTHTPVFSGGLWRDTDGTIFTFTNTTGMNDRKFGMGFWSPRASANRVSKWSPSSKPAWTVGQHAPASEAQPGEAKYLYTITGVAHGCVVINDVEESLMHVWDQDGLWVGRLLENPVIGPDSPKSVYELCGENFGGSLYTNPKTGEVLFFGAGYNNVMVYRISGWDQFQRQSGSVSVSPSVAQQLRAKAQAEASRTDLARIGYLESRQMKIDGDLAEWKSIKPIVIEDGKQEVAKVYVGWTPEGLVAAFDVTTKKPWKSAGSEQLPFQGGAAVDISFAPLSLDAKDPLYGQARYVVAPINGKTTLVEILPKLAKDMSPPHSTREVTYKTMIGSVTYQRSAVLEGDYWSAAKEKPDGTGYIIEMRVPAHPPHTYRPGYRLRFDASVILASPEGTKAAARIPWHSRKGEDMAVQDTYTEGLLRPTNWGEGILE